MTPPAPKPSVRVIEELRSKMAQANLAIIDNRAETHDEGHIYVRRGDNECCVAKPQCREWALYIGALIKYAPALLAVVEAARTFDRLWNQFAEETDTARKMNLSGACKVATERLSARLSALDATGGGHG